MRSKFYRCMSFIISAVIIASMLGACKKEDNYAQNSGTQTKTTAKTTTKATANTTSKTTTNATEKSAISSATAANNADSVANNVVKGDNNSENNSENQIDESEENNGYNEQTAGEKTHDLKGRVIKLIYQAADQMPVPNSGNKVTETRYQLMKEAEEKFNCKFEFEFMDSWTTVQTKVEAAFMAGTYIADSFRYPVSYALPSFEKMKLILPINDYIDYNDPKWKMGMNADGILYPENVYAIGGDLGPTPMGIWYNNDILSKEGIPDLRDYLDQDNWNWDTFLDIAIRTTKDFNGDGVIDQWGIGAASISYMGLGFLNSNKGVLIARSEETGEFVFDLGNSWSLKAIQFFSDLYNTYQVADKKGENNFVNGFAAMFVREIWYGEVFKTKGMKNFDFMYMPFGPDNPEGKQTVGAASVHTFFFPVNLVEPEAVVNSVLYWLIPWDESKNHHVSADEIYRANAEKAMATSEGIEFHIQATSKPISEFNLDYKRLFEPTEKTVAKEVFEKVSTRSTTATSAVSAVKDIIQSIIDEKMGK